MKTKERGRRASTIKVGFALHSSIICPILQRRKLKFRDLGKLSNVSKALSSDDIGLNPRRQVSAQLMPHSHTAASHRAGS